MICDNGKQFWCDAFKAWCDGHGITPRFGAVGRHGSIALVERFILTLKNECKQGSKLSLDQDTAYTEKQCLALFISHPSCIRTSSAAIL